MNTKINCDRIGCSNNTGFTRECMYALNKNLIMHAKSSKPMCQQLRNEVLELVELVGESNEKV